MSEGEVEDAALRECTEECGLTPLKESIKQRGIIEFVFEGNPEWDNRCHIFTSREWTGELTETEGNGEDIIACSHFKSEMLPRWWDINAIPFHEMWSDDHIWYNNIISKNQASIFNYFRMPELFSGKEVYYRFFFNKDVLLKYEKTQAE